MACAPSEDSDQPGRMIRVFAGRTGSLVVFVMRWLIYCFQPTQFLSDVGGAIGLWIGLSVLAFCEIFQLITELIGYGIHRVKKNQNRERKKEKERSRRRRREKLRASSNSGEKFGQWPHTEFDSYVKMDKGFPNDKGHLRDSNSINIPRDYKDY